MSTGEPDTLDKPERLGNEPEAPACCNILFVKGMACAADQARTGPISRPIQVADRRPPVSTPRSGPFGPFGRPGAGDLRQSNQASAVKPPRDGPAQQGQQGRHEVDGSCGPTSLVRHARTGQ